MSKMLFDDYLSQKHINAEKFKLNDAAIYLSWASIFTKMHPKSFSLQKLFLLNKVREKYPAPRRKIK